MKATIYYNGVAMAWSRDLHAMRTMHRRHALRGEPVTMTIKGVENARIQ